MVEPNYMLCQRALKDIDDHLTLKLLVLMLNVLYPRESISNGCRWFYWVSSLQVLLSKGFEVRAMCLILLAVRVGLILYLNPHFHRNIFGDIPTNVVHVVAKVGSSFSSCCTNCNPI